MAESSASIIVSRETAPPGVPRIVLFQFWDTLAFRGSQLLLVLYLVDALAHPAVEIRIWQLTAAHDWASAQLGLQSNQTFVSAIYGLFGGLAYLTPVIGGALSDRFISRRTAVIVGSLFMAAGHAMLALQTPFLIGLVCLACGNGFYRGAAGALLASRFEPGDPRVAGVFQLWYLASMLAALAAPLVCGTLGEAVGWSQGFGAASIAMAIGLTIFLSIPRALLNDIRPIQPTETFAPAADIAPRLVLIAAVALFMIGNEQLGNAMVIWLKASVDRHFGSVTIPVTWFFSITPVSAIAGTMALARRQPEAGLAGLYRRMVFGCLIGGGSWVTLALAAAADLVPAAAVVLFLLVWGVAFAFVLPSGAALMAVLTPEAKRGRWLSFYALALMIASLTVGWLGGFYGQLSHAAFIAGHAAIVLAGGSLLAVEARRDRISVRP